MKCPVCNNPKTKVVDTRVLNQELTIRRRRECLGCHFRFTTCEQVKLLNLLVLKKDDSIESYNKRKLESGLLKALEKRPFSEEEIKKLVCQIEQEILKLNKRRIRSKEIGNIVMEKLKKVDEVAYIRFASVYRSFKDLESFEREVYKVKKNI